MAMPPSTGSANAPGTPHCLVEELREIAQIPDGQQVVERFVQWATRICALLPTSLSPGLRVVAASAAPDVYTQAHEVIQSDPGAREEAGILPLLAATQLFYDPAAFAAGAPAPTQALPFLLPPRSPLLPTAAETDGDGLLNPVICAQAAAVVLDKATEAARAKPALAVALLGLRLAHSNAQFLAGNVKGSFEADVYAIVGSNSRTTIGHDLVFPRPGQLPGAGLDALFDPGPPAALPWQTVFPLAHLTQTWLLCIAAQDGRTPEDSELAIARGASWFKRLLAAQSTAQDEAYAVENAVHDGGSGVSPEVRLQSKQLNQDIEVRGAAAVQEVQSVMYILNGRTLDAAQALIQLAIGSKAEKKRIPYLLQLASIAVLLAPASAARDRVLDALAGNHFLAGPLEPVVRAAACGRSLGSDAAKLLQSQAGVAGQRSAPLSANDKALFAASHQGPEDRPHAPQNILEYALATHNVRAAGKVYSRITMERLGELVSLSTVGVEALVRTMVREHRLSAFTDQKAGTISFAPPGRTLDATPRQTHHGDALAADDTAAPGTVAVESIIDPGPSRIVSPLDLHRVVTEHAAAHTGTSFAPQSQQDAQGATAAIAVWDARVAAVASAVEKAHFALTVRGDVPAL